MERTTSIQNATILAFPAGGRRGALSWDRHRPALAPTAPPVVDCDAWYHQAAVDDAKPRGSA